MNTERGNRRANARAALFGATGVLWALIATVALAGPAVAYGPGATPPPSIGSPVVPVATNVPALTSTHATGLAFTGADVAGLIAIAFVLIAIGLAVRAMGRHRQAS